MRTNRIGAFVASTALAAATILGGAGIASADPLGSLGSSAAAEGPALELTLDEADVEATSGTIVNLTEDEATSCVVAVSDADVVEQYEAYYAANEALPAVGSDAEVAMQEANALGQNWLALGLSVDAEDSADWVGSQGATPAADDYRAGAFVQCEIDGEQQVAFAYEPAGFIGSVEGVIGSIDFGGSLGSITGS